MKTLRLSDEDYQALLDALRSAHDNADILAMRGNGAQPIYQREVVEAQRLRDLLQPIDYEEASCKSE